MLADALGYAGRGWPVFPLRGKRPLTPSGFKDACADPVTIVGWWAQWPAANIGLPTGSASGLVVIDVDPRNGGDLAEWQPAADSTLSARTGGGGYHLFYAAPLPPAKYRARLGDGVDVKADGGYVVVPPSIHPDSGEQYRWRNELPPAPLPNELLGRIRRPPPPSEIRGEQPPDDDDRPGSRFNAEAKWEDILPQGWQIVTVDPTDGEVFWRRPGKEDEGWSATTGYRGSGVLWVFSTATDFDPEVSYTKFGAYAHLHHGGDLAEAARYLAGNGDRIVAWGRAGRNHPPAPREAPAYAPAFPPGHVVTDYTDYASALTDAPPEYHEAAILAVLGCLTYGNRLRLATFPDGLSTNLYVLLVGPSTRSRKSTSQLIARRTLEAVRPDVALSARLTGEAAIRVFARRSGQPSLWIPDEFGVFIGEVYRRDFLRPFEELLLTLYGGGTYEYQTVSETITVRDPHLSVLGAATPESLALAGQRAQLGGLLPRFGVVFPERLPDVRPPGEAPPADVVSRVQASLRTVFAFAQQPGTPRELTATPSALSLLNAAEAGLSAERHTARLPVTAYKIAALSALAQLRREIQAPDAAGAVAVIGRWAEGANRLRPFLRRRAGNLEFEGALEETLAALSDLGGTAPRVELARLVRLEKGLLSRIRDTLEDRGLIRVEMEKGTERWHKA